MEEDMKDYIVMVETERGKAFDKGALSSAFNAVRQPISDILDRTGGEMIVDGKGYGVKGHRGEYSPYLLVTATEPAAEEIRHVKGVSLVEENGLVYASKKKNSPKV